MDHLLLPAGAHLTEDDVVPCLAEQDYIGIDFKQYALQNDFHHLIPEHRSLGFGNYEALHPTPQPRLEKFMQTWAFFGLLQEILGSAYRHHDFVVSRTLYGQHAQVLCTANLLRLLHHAFSQSRHPTDRVSYTSRVTECFKLADQAQSIFNRINPMVALSIDVLHETIMHAAIAHAGSDIKLMHTSGAEYLLDSYIARLTTSGCCRNEARYILGRFRGASCPFFLSKMQRNYTIQDHAMCEDKTCVALQIDTNTYQPRHRTQRCSCELVSVDGAELHRILEAGKLPLLTIHRNLDTGKVSTEMIASNGNMPYIALSHIWADGLGNPGANALHACQLEQLRDFASALLKADAETNNTSAGRPWIWLDTLCCPSQPSHAKTAAMGMMRKVYQEATHVLVLDDTICTQSYTAIIPLQAAIMVFIAPWNRRLWCLQEGALAKNLWFQFQERAVNLSKIFENIRQAYLSKNPSLMVFALELGTLYRRLRAFFHASERNNDRNLTTMVRVVKERSVSVASDEPLCLAALFQLNIEVLAKESDGRIRMARWWRMMGDAGLIPSSVIFAHAPRLDVPGFRWAPVSLLDQRVGTGFDSDSAEMHSQGLMVRYAGFSMTPAQCDGYPVIPLMSETEPFILRDKVTGQWYSCQLLARKSEKLKCLEYRPPQITATSLHEFVQSKPMSLIYSGSHLDEGHSTPNQSIGSILLVELNKVHDNCRYVSTVCTANLMRYGAGHRLLLDHAYTIGQNLRHHEASLMYGQEQKLYTDVHEAEKSSSYLAASKAVSDLLISQLGKLIEDPTFVERLKYHFPDVNVGVSCMVSYIWNVYFGGYLDIDVNHAADTLWCID